MNHNNKPTELAPTRSGSASLASPRRIDIRELLGDGRELRILHGDDEYRLALTRNGKLILTK